MSDNSGLKYKRILLKLSGEALAGDKGQGLDFPTVENICKSIKKTADAGAEIGIVVGGGNFWRGRDCKGSDRARADHIGMLATTMNALFVADVLEGLGCIVRVQTAITMQQVAEPYIRLKAMNHLKKGRIVIFGCGTGNPFFSTDTAAALRAVEIEADIFFKATMVDGVYDKDPIKFADAKLLGELSYDRALADNIKVMDDTAIALAKDNKLPIVVCNMFEPGNIAKIVVDEDMSGCSVVK